jgi:hypothetical protein
MAFDRSAFEARIKSLGLKHFNADEVLVRTTAANRFGTRNSRPPLKLWDNIIPTIIILDALRAELGKKMTLISGYRSEEYNQSDETYGKGNGYSGRPAKGQHMAFTAFDFVVEGRSAGDVATKLWYWQNERKKFFSPVSFERKAHKVSAGNIQFAELSRDWSDWPRGVWFWFDGFIKPYTKDNYTHIDTRGKTERKGE